MEVKYIPCGVSITPLGMFIVDPEGIEIITESGRSVKGYLKHRCSETAKISSPSNPIT